MKIFKSVFGQGGQGYRVPATGSIVAARRRSGSDPMETAVRAVTTPRARPDTRGAWYQDWLLTAVDGNHIQRARYRGQRSGVRSPGFGPW